LTASFNRSKLSDTRLPML